MVIVNLFQMVTGKNAHETSLAPMGDGGYKVNHAFDDLAGLSA